MYANLVLKKEGTLNPMMNGTEIRDYVRGDAICFVRCVAQCEAFIPGHISGRNESLPQSQGDFYDSCSLALTVTSTEKCAGSARHHHQRWTMLLRRAFTCGDNYNSSKNDDSACRHC